MSALTVGNRTRSTFSMGTRSLGLTLINCFTKSMPGCVTSIKIMLEGGTKERCNTYDIQFVASVNRHTAVTFV